MQNFFTIEILLHCSKCHKKTDDCSCIVPQQDLLNVFSIVMLKCSDVLFTAQLKNQENFLKMFEVSEAEREFLVDYLKDNRGGFSYKMNERVEFNTAKSVIVQ